MLNEKFSWKIEDRKYSNFTDLGNYVVMVDPPEKLDMDRASVTAATSYGSSDFFKGDLKMKTIYNFGGINRTSEQPLAYIKDESQALDVLMTAVMGKTDAAWIPNEYTVWSAIYNTKEKSVLIAEGEDESINYVAKLQDFK